MSVVSDHNFLKQIERLKIHFGDNRISSEFQSLVLKSCESAQITDSILVQACNELIGSRVRMFTVNEFTETIRKLHNKFSPRDFLSHPRIEDSRADDDRAQYYAMMIQGRLSGRVRDDEWESFRDELATRTGISKEAITENIDNNT